MTKGSLIAVVGPSGVGKDSVMAGMRSVMHDLHLIRRVITREPGLNGEDYEAVSTVQFSALVQANAFALHWRAHNLHYGIPVAIKEHLTNGTDCLVNLSRSALTEAAEIFPNFRVLSITARPDILAKRLQGRGRESAAEIAKRLAQAQKPLPSDIDVIHLTNDGPLEKTISHAVQLFQPVS